MRLDSLLDIIADTVIIEVYDGEGNKYIYDGKNSIPIELSDYAIDKVYAKDNKIIIELW